MLLKVVRLLDLEILSERTFVKIFLLPLSYTFISQEKKSGYHSFKIRFSFEMRDEIQCS